MIRELVECVSVILNNIICEGGYNILLTNSNYDKSRDQINISTKITKGVDVIIISTICKNSDGIRMLTEELIKTVFIDDNPSSSYANSVYLDHEKGTRTKTENLLQAWHQNFLRLNDPTKYSPSIYLRKGCIETLAKYDCPSEMR